MLSYLIYFGCIWMDLLYFLSYLLILAHVSITQSVSSYLIHFITSSLIKYLEEDCGHIFPVLSSLMLFSMGWHLPDCNLFILKLITNDDHKYHIDYYWPNIFSFALWGLLSLNLWHSFWWVYAWLENRTLKLTHGLHYSKLNRFLFWYWLWSGCMMYNWHFAIIGKSGIWHQNTCHPIYVKPPIAFMPCFMATKSMIKTDVSTIDCVMK